MTADRLRAILERLHWSQRDLAHHTARDERTARRWAAGAFPIPPEIADWLERLAAWWLENPPPTQRR